MGKSILPQDFLLQLIHDNVDTYRAGVQTGILSEQQSIRAIVIAYDKALADPQFKAPTYLHAAIELARAKLPADPFAERRSEPRPDHDLDTNSAPLKAGS